MEISNIREKIKRKDQKFISTVYNEVRSSFIKFIKRYASIQTEEALEFYQDAFSILYENITEDKVMTGNVESYLIGIGKNLVNENYKYKKKLVRDFLDNDLHTATFMNELEDQIHKTSKDELVRLAVAALNEPCNKILTLFYWSKMKYDEMLSVMTTFKDVGSIKSQKYKCMQRLESKVKGLFQQAKLS